MMWDRIKSNLALTYEVLFAAAKEYGNDRVNRMAAAVAYRAMFATAPLFLVVVSIAGFVLGSNEEAQAQILTRVAAVAGDEVADALGLFIDSVVDSGSTAAIVGVVLLFWTASSLFIALQRDLNDVFHVPQETIRGIMGTIRKRTLGFLWVLGVGLAFIAVWMVNALWRFIGDEVLPADAENVHAVVGWLTPVVSVILLPVILGLFFQTMSAVKVRWRAVWWGSFFTTVGFLVAAYGIGLYFAWDDETSASQVAASIFVVLLLAYVLSTVFLVGAEVTKVYNDYLELGDVRAPGERARDVRPPEVLVSEPDRSMPLAAVFAFLFGLFVGWRRRG